MKKLYTIKINYGTPRGYIALLSLILISAIGVAIMISVVTSGINAAKTDFSLQQGGLARNLASSCTEEALQLILETRVSSSSGSLTIASGTCTYLITSSSSIITVKSTGYLGAFTSKIKVVIATTSPSVTLSSWEEVADF